MKMIDVLNKQCRGEIRKGTKLIVDFSYEQDSPEIYIYNGEHFVGEGSYYDVIEIYSSHTDTLNAEVELISPKPKKYLVKINIRGLLERFTYLNYCENSGCVNIHDKYRASSIQTKFTKDELQSIKSVREFLEDIEGKYELIEVEDNEID